MLEGGRCPGAWAPIRRIASCSKRKAATTCSPRSVKVCTSAGSLESSQPGEARQHGPEAIKRLKAIGKMRQLCDVDDGVERSMAVVVAGVVVAVAAVAVEGGGCGGGGGLGGGGAGVVAVVAVVAVVRLLLLAAQAKV